MPGGESAEAERQWRATLPKAEVHLHLEGSIGPEIVSRAAHRHALGSSSAPPGITPGKAPDISSLSDLLTYLDWSCGLIRDAEDLSQVAYDLARRASFSGTRHVDVIVNPTHWVHWRDRLGSMVDVLDHGFAEAEADGYPTATLCISLNRDQTATEAEELVGWMLQRRHPRVAALSIDGNEASGSHTDRFVGAFEMAAKGALHTCAHAGESSGPQGVREAVDQLGAQRIDHGVRAIEDDDLVRDLAFRRIPLGICPTSNVVLGLFGSLDDHPVDRFLKAGVRISLNTDDPLLFDCDVAGEYDKCAETFRWTRKDVAAVARTSIEASFADPDRKQMILSELDGFLSQ